MSSSPAVGSQHQEIQVEVTQLETSSVIQPWRAFFSSVATVTLEFYCGHGIVCLMTEFLRRFGIFGGTFDPIHMGHIECLRQVRALADLDKIFFVPAAVPPHRPPTVATAQQRLRMVQIALADETGFLWDDRELRRDSPSYTIDTIHSFLEEYPDSRPCLILGLDAMLGFEKWHRWMELLDLCDIIVMQRPGWSWPEDLPQWWLQRIASENNPGSIQHLSIQPYNLSATEIRDSISSGEDVEGYLPKGVLEYITSENLYRGNMTITESPEMKPSDSETMKATILEALDDAKGLDIRVLDVQNLTDVTDYMIVSTGSSDRHVKTLADRVLKMMHDAGWQHMGVEGEDIKEWILVDFVDVVVHIMRESTREMYDLESLWDETLSEVLRTSSNYNASIGSNQAQGS